MRRKQFIRHIAVGLTASFFPQVLLAVSKLELPEVLILGDSISIGYTPYVKEMLAGKAEVHRPVYPDGSPENCEGTTKGVAEVNRWLGDKKWDIIHFNFGLHDLKHVDPETHKNSDDPGDPYQAGLNQYVKNLKQITGRLKQTGARLIFATTTPVAPGTTGPVREPETVRKYNKAAVRLMKKEGIVINDLYNFALPILDEIQIAHNVHYTGKGYKKFAEEISGMIAKYL